MASVPSHVLSICAAQTSDILARYKDSATNGCKANHVNSKYICAALLIHKGHCKKKNGKPNYTAAAKAVGVEVNKNLKGVKDWVLKIQDLERLNA